MSRKIVMTLVCILVLGLSGCGDTLTLNQYNTSEIWYIAYTDIDTVCESNELSRITHRTGGVSHFPQGRTGTPLFSCPLLRSRQEKALDLCGFAGAVFSG